MFFGRKKALKILFVAPEAAPFVKAGGLGEVMFALPRALAEIGHDARVMIPRFASIDQSKYRLTMEHEALQVPTDAEEDTQTTPAYLICNVKKYTPEKSGDTRQPVTSYFLENQEYYEFRSNIYGYTDDAIRWALLSRGTLEFLRVSKWVPDVIVANDWQTGFLVNYLHTVYKNDAKLNKIASLFVIHNLSYQGMFDHRFVNESDYDDGQSLVPSFFNPRLLRVNALRRGILHADSITTVSPNYSKEIMTKEYGELLDDLLRERRSRLYGVLNGIDYEVFNSSVNPNLAANYNEETLSERAKNKEEAQGRFGLDRDPSAFLLSIVSRFSEQKGFDLLFDLVEVMLRELKMQILVLGSGDSRYMSFFKELETKHPGRVGAHLNFDRDLPHLVYGGSDAVLIPSKFEPSGLTQMEAMRYGCVPIARRTGGLADTVKDYDPKTNTGTGFTFEAFDAQALLVAMARAYENYRNPAVWQKIQKSAMKHDFSWKHSAEEYERVANLAMNFAEKRGNP